jgi:predicted transcriptional regulator of viral defense system
MSLRGIRSSRGRDRLAVVLRENREIVTPEGAARALGIRAREASKLLARWAHQGWLKRLRRGLYAPIPIDAQSKEQTLRNPWVLVPTLFAPGYIGGWSAAAHWGLTEQIFRDVCVFTGRPFRSKRVTIEGTTFILNRVPEEAIFGTAIVWEANVRIAVSDPHRTLVDILARPSTGGGIRHVEACLSTYLQSSERSLDLLIAYGERLGNGAVFKRLGFLLERSKCVDEAVLAACRDRLTSGNATLDPVLRPDHLITRWKLWVPALWTGGRGSD